MKKVLVAIGIFLGISIAIGAVVAFVKSPFVLRSLEPNTGVLISEDGGETWHSAQIFKQDKQSGAAVTDIEFSNNGEIPSYLTSRSGGLFVSYDRGEIWEQLTENFLALSVAVDSQDPGFIFAGIRHQGQGRIIRSPSEVSAFEPVYTSPLKRTSVSVLSLDPKSGALWAGTTEGLLLKSTDDGTTWQKVYEFDDAPIAISPNLSLAGDILVAVESRGIFRSLNNGVSFGDLKDTLRDFRGYNQVYSLKRDPQNSYVVYSSSEFGLLRSQNGGTTWEAVNLVIPEDSLPVSAIAIHPRSRSTIFAGAGSNLYKSENRGETWSVQRLSREGLITVIEVDPLDINRVIVGLVP